MLALNNISINNNDIIIKRIRDIIILMNNLIKDKKKI